jgi:putative two-component system response regulator
MADDTPSQSSVVLVDDDPVALGLLSQLLTELEATKVTGFPDPLEAFEWCRRNPVDLLITDQQMPGMSGTELIRRLRQEPRCRDVPVLMVTAVQDVSVRREALLLGASDCLSKPFDAVEAGARIRNLLALRRSTQSLARYAASLEEEVRRATAAITAREHEAIVRLARATEYRDWETGAHIVRVAWYSRLIARGLRLPDQEQDVIFRAAPMHDVGKIGVPDYILLKPSALDDIEFGIMKQHTVLGHRILAGSSSELLQLAADVALTHHERFDGTGYPDGRSGEAIPLAGRIVAVADSYDALTSERPYKSEWPTGLAVAYLQQHAGSHFDPDCVRTFLEAEREIAEIRGAFPDSHGRAAGRESAIRFSA